MKKIMTLGAFALGICSAQAGTVPQIIAPSLTEVPVERHVKQPFSVTLGGGLMQQQTTAYDEYDGKNLPTVLYGGTLGFTWDLAKTRSLVHSLGCSVGVYHGSQKFGSFESYQDPNGEIPEDVFTMKTWVDAIPLTASYNVKYDLTDSVSVFGGLRAGAMIRHTRARGHRERTEGWNSDPASYGWDGVSSTKVLPMCGFGLGAQAYVTSRVSLFLSYDFEWTFGDDCDRLYNNSGDGEWYLKATSRKHRFYGTLNVGVTYSF